MFAINLDTGDRSILSDGALETIELRNPGSIALDPDRNQLLVAENNTGRTPFIALVGVDLATGARRIVSGTTPGSPFFGGVDVVEGGSLAVVSSDRYLFLIDLSDGSRSVLAGADVGNGDWPFGVGDVVYDPGRRVVYGWSSYSEALIEFSIETGDRVVRSK